jgi:HTH-type transcriptional regulator/antitoxin HigA
LGKRDVAGNNIGRWILQVFIKTEKDYEKALARINDLMDADPGTPEGDELELLVTMVELYEKAKHLIDLPDPLGAIKRK